MANICVSCGSDIPEECGSMICSCCSRKIQLNDAKISSISAKTKEIIFATFSFEKNNIEEINGILEDLKSAFSDNIVIAVPDSVSINTMDTAQLRSFIWRTFKIYIKLLIRKINARKSRLD